MKAIAGGAERGPAAAVALTVSALAVLGFKLLTGQPLYEITVAVALVVVSAMAYKHLLAWRSLLGGLILIILFIPVRRYTLPGQLPFQLEPYRLFVAFLVLAWGSSLLIDPRVRLRRSGVEAPLGLFVAAVLASDVVNPARVSSLSGDVAKALTFFLSFYLVFYVFVSVVRTRSTLEQLVTLLTAGGSIVACLAIVESRTGYNVFSHLNRLIPFLQVHELPHLQGGRGDRLRTVASAEHAIALSALLVMLIPLAIYLLRKTGQRRWILSIVVLLLGALSTVSRTGILMLVALGVVFIWLRPRESKRCWPALVPLLLAAHFVLPGTLGPLKNSFFPQGGLVKEQEAAAGTRGSGRIADLGPSLHEAKQHLLLGEGYGTRIVDWGRANAPILDDQWLGTLLETGLVGVVALLWLFVRTIRRLGRRAKEDESVDGWLATGLAAAITAFAVGMFTYDAFAFIQVTFILFIMLGLSTTLLVRAPEPEPKRATNPDPDSQRVALSMS
jgi:hypothetical protein